MPFFSGKMLVFQVVLPIVTFTGTEPKPRRGPLWKSLICWEVFKGTVTKCQEAFPDQSQTSDLKVNVGSMEKL